MKTEDLLQSMLMILRIQVVAITHLDSGVGERQRFQICYGEIFLRVGTELCAFRGNLRANSGLVIRVVCKFIHEPREGACSSSADISMATRPRRQMKCLLVARKQESAVRE